MMLVLNLGSKYITMELSESQDELLKNKQGLELQKSKTQDIIKKALQLSLFVPMNVYPFFVISLI